VDGLGLSSKHGLHLFYFIIFYRLHNYDNIGFRARKKRRRKLAQKKDPREKTNL
jgi:hypothetical protein